MAYPTNEAEGAAPTAPAAADAPQNVSVDEESAPVQEEQQQDAESRGANNHEQPPQASPPSSSSPHQEPSPHSASINDIRRVKSPPIMPYTAILGPPETRNKRLPKPYHTDPKLLKGPPLAFYVPPDGSPVSYGDVYGHHGPPPPQMDPTRRQDKALSSSCTCKKSRYVLVVARKCFVVVKDHV